MQPTVLVGTTDGLHELGEERRVQLAGHEVTSLARGDSGWWAIIDGREVWRSGDDDEWKRIAAAEALRTNCLVDIGAELFVGISEAHLFALQGDSLEPVSSFEKVQGREEWFTPWGGPPDVRSMSADSAGGVYVNVHVGGVVRSTDGGRWKPTIDINADVHQVLFDPGSDLVLAATARGLAISDDGGESWTFSTEGLHGSYLRAVAVAGEAVLVSASTGPSTSRAAIYRRALKADGPFQRCQRGLPEWFPSNIDTACVSASGSVAAFGTSEGSLFISSDEGTSWSAAEDLPPVRCVALA